MFFRSSEGVFGDFLVNFGRFEILENDDVLMVKIHFGFTRNLSMSTWDRFDSNSHVSVPDRCQNGPKVGRVSVLPAVARENHDYHRISHGLKPLIHGSFCFQRPI